MASVEISNVYKRYGILEVLHGVNVEIDDGEFVALVGPSGCGKSTLLRMIAGLENISDGDIIIGNRIVNEEAPKDRDIAMVFQSYALYPHMTVAENMAFSLKLKGVSKEDRAASVARAAAILGLQPLLTRYPRELSGGQRQRVAMGRAIVRNPQVFLFDEPLSNLDAKLRVSMRAEVKELHQRLKTTTIYVTHDQVEAMTMADKIVVMHDGIVEQCGKPLDLYDRPGNLFVAGFIGSPSMNFMEGTVHLDGASIFKDAGGLTIPIEPQAQLNTGDNVVLGIRPEHLEISDRGIPVRVTVIEPTGSELQIIGRTPGGSELVANFRDRHDFKPGQDIFLNADPKKIHLFHKDTGRRVGQIANGQVSGKSAQKLEA